MKLFTKQTAVLLALVILCLTGCTPTPKGYVKRATAIMDKRGLYATGDGWYNMKYGLIHANPQTMEEAHALVSEGSILILTTSKDVARTGEEFCDDPIAPDSLTETPLADALQWLKDKTMAE